jgi:hypothetical protein
MVKGKEILRKASLIPDRFSGIDDAGGFSIGGNFREPGQMLPDVQRQRRPGTAR